MGPKLLPWLSILLPLLLVSAASLKPATKQRPAPAPVPISRNIDSKAYAPGPKATSGDAHAVSPSPLGITSADIDSEAYAPAPRATSGDTLAPSPSPLGMTSPTSENSSAPEPEAEDTDPTTELPEETDPSTELPEETEPKTVKWCAVRDEFVNCQYYISLLSPVDDYRWKCVKRKTAFDCMEAIKNKEADLISLDSGFGYIAFKNYSLKAIMAEEYCNHADSYDAVAVVNKRMCNKKSDLSLNNFRGMKSCHAGYMTAAGWNYPVHHLVNSVLRQQPGKSLSVRNDETIISNFFSASSAPSEVEGKGLCSACGNSSSCLPDNIYSGYSGAFRCLVEGIGDIAFLKADTALLYSLEGLNNQSWSTKSISDFMYLCPQGGCRPINNYPGDCKFGSVPANTIMTRNSLPHSKKLAIVQTLLNASWTDALYSGKNWADHLLTVGTQSLQEVKQLTRSYLGFSARVSQGIEDLNTKKVEIEDFTKSLPQVASSSSKRSQLIWTLSGLLSLYMLL